MLVDWEVELAQVLDSIFPGPEAREGDTSYKGLESLVVVCGVSGAGSTSALRIIADLGFDTVDNLPIGLFPAFLRVKAQEGLRCRYLAMIFDTTTQAKVLDLCTALRLMRERGLPVYSVYVDSDNEKLIQRYSETRRPHPVYDPVLDRGFADTIERERYMLAPLRQMASVKIDTTELSVHDLKRTLSDFIVHSQGSNISSVFLVLQSFGFKYGIPSQSDMILDVRFLGNPYFVKELKELTGLDEEVFHYVMNDPEAKELLSRFLELLRFLVPRYIREGKSQINISIGCTGGKHRSVSIVRALLADLQFEGVSVMPLHRDVRR